MGVKEGAFKPVLSLELKTMIQLSTTNFNPNNNNNKFFFLINH